jgi:hypothetical protein
VAEVAFLKHLTQQAVVALVAIAPLLLANHLAAGHQQNHRLVLLLEPHTQ